ncbi:MAG TPA: hypothetical protein VHC04_15510 [Rhodopila sp.]|nr:hypothetical protein [Rhodopila sp.]
MSQSNLEIVVWDDSAKGEASLIYGNIDKITIDPVLGVFSVEGRDLSALLIDSYVQQDFVNQTAAEVVFLLAGRYGLLAEVTPTEGLVGRYFADGYARLGLGDHSRFRSNWDLIVELAREQGFDVYVKDRTLYFGPALGSGSAPITLHLTDTIRTQFEYNTTLSTTPLVQIQTWDSQQLSAYKGWGQGTSAEVTGLSADNTGYLFSQPNLTAAQADAKALMYSREISRLNTIARIEMPWNLNISPRGLISLIDTGTSFDGLYRVDCVERLFCTTSGSVQFVTAVPYTL